MKALVLIAAALLLAALANAEAQVHNQTESTAADQNQTIPDSVKEIPQAAAEHGVSGQDVSFDDDAEADSGPENNFMPDDTFEQENLYHGDSRFGFGPWRGGYRGHGWGPFRGGWRRRWGWGWGGRPGWGWGGHW